ncbi:hypothetical protein WG70_13205 [Burkholderia oklahomensis EO147]|nr:hypothetical protein WG70_13205 [Burkholderia oklahomensis EO147]AOI44331.1 hypothetical protein WI23_00040 [Burkholderia oklahomensis C6786]KUY55558.1 hypothetical protein WG70_12060 [Burkholderia oklahomensis EO147]KUY61659.1 hypothetical protein WI23_10790 [Burkholderia oklahomensis C6786]
MDKLLASLCHSHRASVDHDGAHRVRPTARHVGLETAESTRSGSSAGTWPSSPNALVRIVE